MKQFYVEYDFIGSSCWSGTRPSFIRYFRTKEEAEAFAKTTADGVVGEMTWFR